MGHERVDDPARWTATNLVGVPAALLGSTAFNEQPRALQVAGVRDEYRGLFDLLERSPSLAESRALFASYMNTCLLYTSRWA